MSDWGGESSPKPYNWGKLLELLMEMGVLKESMYYELWGNQRISWNPFDDESEDV